MLGLRDIRLTTVLQDEDSLSRAVIISIDSFGLAKQKRHPGANRDVFYAHDGWFRATYAFDQTTDRRLKDVGAPASAVAGGQPLLVPRAVIVVDR